MCAFLHCHTPNCNWSQDDFWEIGKYTPFRKDIIEDMEKNLFKDKIYMDRWYLEEYSIPHHKDNKGYYCKGTDLVAAKLEKKAKNIRNMLVRTFEEFKTNKDKLVCPKCGKQNWDID